MSAEHLQLLEYREHKFDRRKYHVAIPIHAPECVRLDMHNRVVEIMTASVYEQSYCQTTSSIALKNSSEVRARETVTADSA